MGGFAPRKDRRVPTPYFREAPPVGKPENMPLGNTTKTLSPEWKPFALSDGGVLFTHPTRDQVMEWNNLVISKEHEAVGIPSRQHAVQAKVQSLMADNTLEHLSLSQWRRANLRQLIHRHKGSAAPVNL